MLYPPPLKKGDRIIIIAPSGVVNPEYVFQTQHLLTSWGFQVTLGQHVLNQNGCFAGTVEERLQDIRQALDSSLYQAVFCARGGYGCVQLLEAISFEKFKKYPKWVIGYSDITALHSAICKEGICSLHAPMSSHLAREGEDEAGLHLKNVLFGKHPNYSVEGHPLNRTGQAEGFTRGGNLAVLQGLRGTPYDLLTKNTLLFVEDIGEKSYQIERMVYNLRFSGILSKIAGLIVGQFSNCEEDTSLNKPIYEAIRALLDNTDFPVCFNFPVGHVKQNFPLIVNGKAAFSVNNNQVTLSY